MSRFFRGGDDSSSESSSDEELYGTEEEEEEENDQLEQDESDDDDMDQDSDEESESDSDTGDVKKGTSRFLLDVESSESEESDVEGATKVKSAKDKRFDELEATITAIQNGQKINDWGSISNGSCWCRWIPCFAYENCVLTSFRSQNSTNSTVRLSSCRMAARPPSRTSSVLRSWRTS